MGTKTDLIIIGAGGHARVAIDIAELNGYNISGIIDLQFKNQDESILGYSVLGSIENLPDAKTSAVPFTAVGDNEERQRLFEILLSRGYKSQSLIHPAATISPHAEIGRSVLINSGAVINAGAKIGDNVIINTGATIDHETVIGDHTHIAPGVNIAGRVRIGRKCFIGIGAAVIDKITVGENSTIGAGSVVIKDVPGNAIVAGVPAKVVE